MRLSILLLTAALTNAALAGCFADEDDQSAADDGGGAAAFPPPIAALVVSIDGNVTDAAAGAIPVKAGVNVTFDASASNGTGIRFAWDMGDGTTIGEIPATTPASSPSANATGNSTGGNATLLPPLPLLLPGFQPNETNATTTTSPPMVENALVVHVFVAAGNFTVTLYVTDEANQTSTAAVDVAVSPAGPAPGTFIRTDKLTFSQAAVNAATACAGTQTKDWVFVDVEAGNGTQVTVAKVKIAMTTGGTNVNGASKLYFIGPDGKEIKSATTGWGAKTLDVEGPLAAGKYQVKAEICQVVAQGTYTVNAEATYVAA